MKEVPLNHGMVALVDDDDFERIASKKWYAAKDGHTHYAQAAASNVKKTVMMHRVILGAAKGQLVDHIDRNGLNNQRSNLRFATHSQNLHNTLATKARSGVRGVAWHSRTQKWRSYIRVNSKRTYLGSFVDVEEAKMAYITASLNMHKEFSPYYAQEVYGG